MAERGRVLAVDAGERRIGLALSDELRLLAAPLRVLRRDAAGLASILDEMRTLVQREAVAEVVVGLPLNADGSAGRQARRAEAFASVARRVLGVPVVLWDERHSSLDAEAVVRSQGRSTRRVRERGELDAVAAAVILQDYLDAQRRERERASRLASLEWGNS